MNKYKIEQLIKRLVITIFGSKVFSFPIIYKLRIFFYKKFFNISNNPIIEHGVWIQKTHGMNGSIKIGANVLLAKNVSIDYSGQVIIEDNVWISQGAIVYSHIHMLNNNRIARTKNNIKPTVIKLRNGCWIGANAIILPQVKKIGKNSIVAAGSIVTQEVPNNVIVAGNPARVVKHII